MWLDAVMSWIVLNFVIFCICFLCSFSCSLAHASWRNGVPRNASKVVPLLILGSGMMPLVFLDLAVINAGVLPYMSTYGLIWEELLKVVVLRFLCIFNSFFLPCDQIKVYVFSKYYAVLAMSKSHHVLMNISTFVSIFLRDDSFNRFLVL